MKSVGTMLTIGHFCYMETGEILIHPSSVIDAGAVIGKGTRIWHFSHLMGSCKVGDNCTIGQNVFIDSNVIIGNRVKIQNNVSVYNGVTVEDDVFLGPSVVFTNVINPRSFIERKNEFRKTRIKNGATIGANATILCGIEIGAYAMLGAGAVILKNVPDFAVMVGNPAIQTGWISRDGNKLDFDDAGIATCTSSGTKYKLQNQIVTVDF